MIEYLQEYITKRAGQAPVWVVLSAGGGAVERTLMAADETGVIMAGQPGGPADCYPWHAIYKISPKV